MSVTYGGNNYNVKYPTNSSTYIDIRDLCPVYKDLPTSTLVPFYGKNNVNLSGTSMDINDAWKETYEVPFIHGDSASTKRQWCVRGTVPQGKNCVAVITPVGWYLTLEDAQNKTNKKDGAVMKNYSDNQDYLKCRLSYSTSSEYLKLTVFNTLTGASTFFNIGPKNSDYKDGVVPKRLLIVIGGGGGGGGNWTLFGESGKGGASGATVAFIVNIEHDPIEFLIGKGASRQGDTYTIKDGVNTEVRVFTSLNGGNYVSFASAGGGESTSLSHIGLGGEGSIDYSILNSSSNKIWKIPARYGTTNLTSAVFNGVGQYNNGQYSYGYESTMISATSNPTYIRTNENILFAEGHSSVTSVNTGRSALFTPGGICSSTAALRDGSLGSGGGGGESASSGYGGRGGDGYVAIYY